MGRVLGERWQVHEKIGTGGMASVHLGVDLRLGRKVACKILHPHVAENPDARERLAREARAIAQLKHENVIEVYDYAIDDPECTWLVTELIEGCSLRQFLDRSAKPMPEVAVMITTEVVKALRAAHAVGVIHRDVKPDNILVGVEGRPKLSDFGIAKVLSESRMTTTGNLVGSPSYMSPEQSDGLHTDHRTDLFSIGIVLYRLVTGTLPFRGGTPIETIRRVSACEYVDPTELAPECAGAVAGIIRRALTRELNGRYQSAEEMLADLMKKLRREKLFDALPLRDDAFMLVEDFGGDGGWPESYDVIKTEGRIKPLRSKTSSKRPSAARRSASAARR
ncbi:MAG: serine/threonine protein kinase [Myxococcales bacterium]|nr:serine/threonine protein kinase [Myxococcales bacterium]